ncbi:MAG: serine/threonine-protein kinase, partial [Myxococcota bacterium]
MGPVGGDRYRRIRRLGSGGQGEVVLAQDRVLDRSVALKTLHVEHLESPEREAEFLDEAKRMAKLQHPNILPVYDWGRLADGRPFYTMRPLEGRTRAARIRYSPTTQDSLRTHIGWVMLACDALAFAHEMGIVHRDITPHNVFIGAFGEVHVIDWGVATDVSEAEAVTLGNPAYCAPEQANGQPATRSSDVFGLGTLLYSVLTGRSVWSGARDFGVARSHPVPSAAEEPLLPVPDDLVALCDACLSRDPTRRPAGAGAVASEGRAWLEGARRRRQAEGLVARADALYPTLLGLRERATHARAAAETILGTLDRRARPEAKASAWALEDDAAEAESRAVLEAVNYTQLLRAALVQAPDLASAHERLADHYRDQHERAAERRDEAAATRLEALLQLHDRGAHAHYLRGWSALTLVTDPPARATLFRFEPHQRRLVPRFVRELGQTPLREVALDRGSYVVLLRAQGCAPVRYPVKLTRGAAWEAIRPGDRDPYCIGLPPEAEVGPGDRYVPAGWTVVGGDPLARDSIGRRRVWIDG